MSRLGLRTGVSVGGGVSSTVSNTPDTLDYSPRTMFVLQQSRASQLLLQTSADLFTAFSRLPFATCDSVASLSVTPRVSSLFGSDFILARNRFSLQPFSFLQAGSVAG